MEELITLLVRLLVVGLVAWFCFWFVDSSGIPAPFNWIIKGIVMIVALIALLPLLGVTV